MGGRISLRVVSMMFALTYVLEELLDFLIGFNAVGALILAFYALVSSCLNGRLISVKTNFIWLFLVITLISITAFSSPLGCSVEWRGVISLLFLGGMSSVFLSINFSRFTLDRLTGDFALMLVAFFLLLGALGMGINTVLPDFTRKGADPFYEPSNLAIYMLPIMATRLLLRPKDKLDLLVLLMSAVLAPSSTLLLGAIGTFGIYVIASKGALFKKIWLYPLLMVLVFAIVGNFSSMDATTDRIQGVFTGLKGSASDGTNVSSLVWLNGWSQAIQTAGQTMWLGTGFNQMGCGQFHDAGVFSPLIEILAGEVLNYNSGSFLVAKLIAELGVGGIGIALFLSWRSIKAILAASKVQEASNSVDRTILIARSVSGLVMLMYLYVRGMGYFHLPFLWALAMLLGRCKPVCYRNRQDTISQRNGNGNDLSTELNVTG